MIRKLTLITAFCFFSAHACLFAQTPSSYYMGAALAVPDGKFAENVSSKPLGVRLGFLAGLGHSRVSLGAEFGSYTYGVENWEGERLVNGAYTTNEYTFSSTITDFSAKIRVNPFSFGRMDPYVEAYAGPSLLRTGLSISVEDENGCETSVSEDVLSHDLSYHYGTGAGVQVRLEKGTSMEGAYLDLGVNYRNGATARYMFRSPEATYETEMDFWQANLGFVFRF